MRAFREPDIVESPGAAITEVTIGAARGDVLQIPLIAEDAAPVECVGLLATSVKPITATHAAESAVRRLRMAADVLMVVAQTGDPERQAARELDAVCLRACARAVERLAGLAELAGSDDKRTSENKQTSPA